MPALAGDRATGRAPPWRRRRSADRQEAWARPVSARRTALTRHRRAADPEKTRPTIEGHRRAEPGPLRVEPAPPPGPGAIDADPQAMDFTGDTVSWNPAIDAEPSDTAAASTAMPLLRRIGQFVLLERLGSGGMGVVFAAFDEQLERKVAIKLVATQGGDERAQQRLLREAQAQARLSHPNVVTVYEVGTLLEGNLFIAMELVKGDTLRSWQEDGARTWREIVAKYAAAGEGLAAAHRGGVVHRDFKPDNVLVGEDGRVRVADFGLAFAAEPEVSATAPTLDASTAGQRPDAAGSRDEPDGPKPPGSGRRSPVLTAAGAVVGTPGYMAPEQFSGGTVDARTDQFAFCVALFEALHGERPHADLAFANGARPPPRRTDPDPSYPRWLWDVVMRGLALEPGERFASMDALVAELTRNRTRLRRRVLAASALAAVLATAAVTSAALTDRGPPACPPATAELSGIWDAGSKLRVAAALLGTGAPFASNVWTSTQTALDHYAQRWIGAQRAACEATHVRHVQSAELLDRRMECLAGRRRSLAAAAEVLQSRPAQAVAHAGEILGSLGEIDLCADTGVLLELPGLGSGTAGVMASARSRALVAEVRGHLARASALLATGDVAAAEPVVADAVRIAKDLDQDPVRAEILYLQGRVKLARGEVADSIELFNRAVELAVASHHDELPPEIWLTLAVSAGSREQRPAETEVWLGQGEAWLRRLGHPNDPRRIDVEAARGDLQLTVGNAGDALVTLSRALEMAEALWGKDDPRLILLLRQRARASSQSGQPKAAVADDERALALGIASWGPEYPDIARTRRALGLLYIEQLGEIERGEHQIALALELYRAQLGGDSIEVANCEQALSQAGQYRGDYAAALGHAERAEQIYAEKLGADHPRRGEALVGLGVLRFMRKDFTGSLAAYTLAYPIMRTTLGSMHASVGVLLSNTGETLLALGRAEAAETDFEQALDILQRSLGPEHTDLALPLKGLGLAYLARGRPRDALAPLERALTLRTLSTAANDPQELAEIRWALARVLHTLGRDPARARALAEAALAGYRGLGTESAGHVQEISRWLRP
jgi:tetratricopeptide (TPR) repeat protein